MALLYIDAFKDSINHPYNIKGFYTQFNNECVRTDVNIKEIEAQILNEKVETKSDIPQMINTILNNANIKRTPTSSKSVRKTFVGSSTFQKPSTTSGESPFKSGLPSYGKSSFDSNDSLEAQFEKIEIESLKGKVRTLMKDLLLQDPHYDVECYEEILKRGDLNKNILLRIYSQLESDLASYEGRTLIQDGLVVLAGFAEGALDGTHEVFGHKPNLKGLASTLEVSLRKRRTETSAIHTAINETFGFGPASKIFFDVAISAASTIQHNSRNTSAIARAVRESERGK